MASLFRPTLARQVGLLHKQASPLAIAAPRFIARPSIKAALPVAAFHTSAKRELLPPLPQKLTGTANDAVAVHPPHPTHGAYHWQFERLVSILTIPVTIAPFIGGVANPIVDSALCATIMIHTHIGFDSVIMDYLPTYRVPGWNKIFQAGRWAALVLVSYGLYEFETNDVGLTEGIKRVWKA